MDFLLTLIGATLRIATPILFAALGESVVELSGVLNLGIEEPCCCRPSVPL